MKRTSFAASVCAVMFLFGSCSTTVVNGDDPNPQPGQTEGKLHIHLTANDYTRAMEEGTVSSLHIAFYYGDECMGVQEAEVSDDGYVVDVPATPGRRPDKIVAFANLDDADVAKVNCGFSALDKVLATGFESAGKGLVMSSARYFEADGKDMLAISLSDANYDGDAVAIFLERVAAKVKFTNGITGNQSVEMNKAATKDKRTLVLTIDGWGLSAIEKSSSLVKSMSWPATGLWTGWSGDHQSHWAHSVSWDNAVKFPVAGQIAPAEGYTLSYPKYSELTNVDGSEVLTHETTRPAEDYAKDNAVASVIIKGHYTLDGTAQTFYKYGDGIYVEAEEDELWNVFLGASEGIFYDAYEKPNLAFFKSAVKLVPVNGTGLYHLQLTEEVTESKANESWAVWIYDSEWRRLQDYDGVNANLIERVGYVEKFEMGKCTFIVPIRHKNYDADVETQAEGAYGLVRNHFYNLTLKSIEGIGAGVASDNDLVLESDFESALPQYKVNMTITVNPWETMTQDINIKK